MCISLDHPAKMKELEREREAENLRDTLDDTRKGLIKGYAKGHFGSMPAETEPVKKDTRVFSTGATRDSDTNKLDYEGFISPLVLRRYAEYMHRCRLRNIPPGDPIRSSDNWQKGIPLEAYTKSLIRHTVEAWIQHDEGLEIEDDTLCAIMFNAMGYLFEKYKLKTRQDG